MLIMVGAFMWDLKHDYDMLDDGDDCLLIIEEADLPWVQANCFNAFREFGMTIKVESLATTPEQVEWCQSQPIHLGGDRWKFVRNWQKVLSCDLAGTKWLGAMHCRARLLQTIGLCELVLNQGVPVLQEYALALLRNAGDAKPLSPTATTLWHRVRHEIKALNLKQITKVNPAEITVEARVSFEEAFGVDVTMQLHMEEALRAWTFEIDGDRRESLHFDLQRWESRRMSRPEEATFWV